MMKPSRIAFAWILGLFAAGSWGCARPAQVVLSSAQVAAQAPAPEPIAADDKPGDYVTPPAPSPPPQGEVTFAQLSADLGDDRMHLDSVQPAGNAPSAHVRDDDADRGTVASMRQATAGDTHRAGPVTVSAGMPVSAVRATVDEGSARLRACYERGVQRNPRLAGRIVVSFRIDRLGVVEAIDEDGSAMPDAKVTACVRDVFEGLVFPAPSSAPVDVVYPVDFLPET